MANEHLKTYLHDHLAGAVVAAELLDHLERAHAGTHHARLFAGLRGDIEADRRELESLAGRVGGAAGPARAAVAWLGEKAARLKLKMDDAASGRFRLLEAAEMISLGIEGKRALWQVLAELSAVVPELRGPDYGRLTDRAADQRRRIEAVRLDAARAALAGAEDARTSPPAAGEPITVGELARGPAR